MARPLNFINVFYTAGQLACRQVAVCNGESCSVVLPCRQLGKLLNFSLLNQPHCFEFLIAIYHADCMRTFDKKMRHFICKKNISMLRLPYVQLFILSIIKNDMHLFRQLFDYIQPADLEFCPYITPEQFNYSKLYRESERCTLSSILLLFRHIRCNDIQIQMLRKVLTKLRQPHILTQIHILECDKYNIQVYNTAIATIASMPPVLNFNTARLDIKFLSTMNIKKEKKTILNATGKYWPAGPCTPLQKPIYIKKF
jgi:hypothetical protein